MYLLSLAVKQFSDVNVTKQWEIVIQRCSNFPISIGSESAVQLEIAPHMNMD